MPSGCCNLSRRTEIIAFPCGLCEFWPESLIQLKARAFNRKGSEVSAKSAKQCGPPGFAFLCVLCVSWRPLGLKALSLHGNAKSPQLTRTIIYILLTNMAVSKDYNLRLIVRRAGGICRTAPSVPASNLRAPVHEEFAHPGSLPGRGDLRPVQWHSGCRRTTSLASAAKRSHRSEANCAGSRLSPLFIFRQR